jgi:hypothetical protein
MREPAVSADVYDPDDGAATDDPFGVRAVLEVDGRLVVRVGGTALGLVESRACRELVRRIATLRGWDPDGAQRERSFGGAGRFTREFVFVDEPTGDADLGSGDDHRLGFPTEQ